MRSFKISQYCLTRQKKLYLVGHFYHFYCVTVKLIIVNKTFPRGIEPIQTKFTGLSSMK